MTSTVAATHAGSRLVDRVRLEVVVPLLATYFVLAVLYAWQAWRREVPTIFTDELELTQIARSIAETGQLGRRGEPFGFTTLAPWLTAPLWWIGDVGRAFDAIKYMQALVMATALFPAYLLARAVVSHPWALFAGAATIAAPALSYAPILVEEPFAYPASTLALWLILRASIRPAWRAFLLALGGCVLATAVRSQLVALAVVLVIPTLVLGWRSAPMRRWRSTWTRWDQAGAAALAVGGVLFVMALIGHLSQDWSVTMALWKGRIVEYGVWAAGAFAVGVGILPLIAALAALVRPRAELRDPATLGYVLVSGSALGAFGLYAGLKGAYISTTFSSLVVERNLIYLAPIAFTSTALLLERRNPRWWAVVIATGFVTYLVVDMPMRLDQYPYYEAHGLAILAFANRILEWPEATIQAWLIGIAVAAGVLLLAVWLLRARRAAAALAAGIAAAVLGWNLLTEIYAANGERDFSDRIAAGLVVPYDWVDRIVGDGSVVLVGQQFADPTGLWLTEFWNRSIGKVWSVDPSSAAPPPGPTVTADLARPDGTMSPEPGTDYALAVNGVRLQGDPIVTRPDGKLYRLDGPIRLAENQTGVYGDGWMGREASYNRFDVSTDGPGFARVRLSREAFCTDEKLPGRVRVVIGPLAVSDKREPSLGRVTGSKSLTLAPCKSVTVLFRPPPGPWRVEVAADTFRPSELTGSSDLRDLGARVEFGFLGL